jgi:predicted esterase
MSSVSLLGFTGCGFDLFAAPGNGAAKLTARPHTPTNLLSAGTHKLGLGGSRDGYLLIPQTLADKSGATLLLSLHGAGIGASGPIDFLGPYAEERGFVLLAPDARGVTWDAIRSGFGPDIEFIDRALAFAFDSCLVHPDRVYIEGFSDGASYALGVGPSNPDLFKRVIAFSPGFITAVTHAVNGSPEIFISHGRQDPVLSYANTEGNIAPTLYNEGFPITFVPYDGEHSVPPSVARQAVDWMLSPLTPRQ